MMYGTELINKLEELLEQANELGHNTESEYDRELFAEWLISKGVTISAPSEDIIDAANINVNSHSNKKIKQPCELWGECSAYDDGYCWSYERPVEDIHTECEYFTGADEDYIPDEEDN